MQCHSKTFLIKNLIHKPTPQYNITFIIEKHNNVFKLDYRYSHKILYTTFLHIRHEQQLSCNVIFYYIVSSTMTFEISYSALII
ncbi:hypothetical protein FDZ61_04330 [Ehrlichia ruminantium]|uniref:Uncharacterized protein n=1 Tax=Ehrlichia ruminantium (strain Welgevonden) TaxID=254945 RepID=A0A0H3M039_EHRRW|nr:hypothetical protein FDZ62_04335 [Ehrlichia ruminantium]QLK56369.1 hypothetical protein FDZ61_04330 [Ehrlichia ruminantium]CAI27304.1 Hypothetical protein ERWE_CDS_08100 [Ehrlichia ruminantium str. Welgevonden]